MRSSGRSDADAPLAGAAPRRSWTWGTSSLSAAGIGVALYLTTLHYGGGDALCTGVGDCEAVNQSAYATLGPIPVAMLGCGAYVSMLAAVVAVWMRPALAGFATLAVFGVALVGALYSAYLTYVEIFVIDAVCPWCVTSAVLMAAILLLATREALFPAYLPAPPHETG